MPKKKLGRSPAPKKPKSPAVTFKTPAVAPQKTDWIGSMKGTFEILGDIVSPASDEDEWDVLRQNLDPRTDQRGLLPVCRLRGTNPADFL